MSERNHYCKEVDVQLGRRLSTDRQVAPKEALDIINRMGTVHLRGRDKLMVSFVSAEFVPARVACPWFVASAANSSVARPVACREKTGCGF